MNKELEESRTLEPDFGKDDGIIPVVVQDGASRQILMLGYVNREALDATLATRYATFYSRSRNKLWTKGETSGDYLRVVDILVDCDQDSLVYLVTREGEGACHTRNAAGTARVSCFFRKVDLSSGPGFRLSFIDP